MHKSTKGMRKTTRESVKPLGELKINKGNRFKGKTTKYKRPFIETGW